MMSIKVCCDFCNQPLDYEFRDGKKRFIFYNIMKEVRL